MNNVEVERMVTLAIEILPKLLKHNAAYFYMTIVVTCINMH